MNTGTKSLLFGVHQFIWHPWTVARAWRALYGSWPQWWEWVAIICHDLGYWGCTDMDGPSGRPHPIRGAKLTREVVAFLIMVKWFCRDPFSFFMDELFRWDCFREMVKTCDAAHDLSIGHSRYYAAQSGVELSRLFKADKCCLLYDPKWLYLLRAKLSGEIHEYIGNVPTEARVENDFYPGCPCRNCPSNWFDWYHAKIKKLCASETSIQEAARSLGSCGPCARR